jgi:hypothetical protein
MAGNGKKPDFDVLVAVHYEANGEKKVRWHNLGAGWKTENGHIAFNLCTNPGVNFFICEREEKARAAKA